MTQPTRIDIEVVYTGRNRAQIRLMNIGDPNLRGRLEEALNQGVVNLPQLGPRIAIINSERRQMVAITLNPGQQ